MIQTAGRVSSCTFQRTVLAALRGTDGGSCHSLYVTSGSLWCRFLLMFVSFIKCCLFSDLCQLGLVAGMTKQMPDGKEADVVNC